jgi:hypothetical protein
MNSRFQVVSDDVRNQRDTRSVVFFTHDCRTTGDSNAGEQFVTDCQDTRYADTPEVVSLQRPVGLVFA